MLGLQANNEKEDAASLKERAAQLDKAIANLQAVADQLDDATAKATISEQIEGLKERKADLEKLAEKKENRAAGIFSFLTGEFFRA